MSEEEPEPRQPLPWKPALIGIAAVAAWCLLLWKMFGDVL
jgi:hypothetical protein